MRVRREKRSFNNKSVPKLEFGNEKAKIARGLAQFKTFRELRGRFEPAPAFGLRQSSAAFCAGITQQGDLKSARAETHAIICRRKIYGTIEKVSGSLSGWIRCAVRTRSVRRHERGRFAWELYQRAKQFRKRCRTFGNRS